MENSFNGYKIINKLNNGASSVQKYELEKEGKKYLLRLYNAKFMNSRIQALENVNFLRENGINVPNVYEYGIFPDKTKGFAILDWISGESLNNILNSHEKDNQYGILVGKELRKLHDCSIQSQYDIYENYIKTLEKKYSKVLKLGINLPELRTLYQYAYNFSEILKQEPLSNIIHGDFHPGNIVVDKSNNIWFIDLDVCKRTHRWEEFASNACNMDFPNFYSNVIISYFDGSIPQSFWQIYYLYGCIYVLDHFLYLERMENKSLSEGKNILKKFLEYSNQFNNNEPTWFAQKEKTRRKVI